MTQHPDYSTLTRQLPQVRIQYRQGKQRPLKFAGRKREAQVAGSAELISSRIAAAADSGSGAAVIGLPITR